MAEQRLIDVNKLISDYGMSTDCDDCKRKSECDYALLMWRDVCAMLDDAPTVDAVEVVRCKDCKYRDEEITIPAPDESPYESFTFAKCPCKLFNLSDDFFCGKGKRKDGDSDD